MELEQKIVDLLREYANGNIDDEEKITAALRTLDVDFDDYCDLHALAAAVEYFRADEPPTANTIRRAAQVVQNGDYLFSEYASDYEDVGYMFFNQKCQKAVLMYLPDWLEHYIDFEALGEDVAEHGEFTSYGFFAPDEGSF